MPRYPRYRIAKLAISRAGERPALWTFANQAVGGTEFTYVVTDYNFSTRNAWEFLVRVPQDPDRRIEVRPRSVPGLRAWAGLERRSLTFTQARRQKYRGWYYCQIALADPTGSKTKDVIRGVQRHRLPPWFADFDGRLREKETVRSTKAADGDQLIALVRPDDHYGMISLFFATKTWVLKEAVVVE
ncbi:MAG: hypothetical protein HY560_00445 [Gemmatimonadetes bacterium]|nr:hypothetical protein [Gemmatimonadota bacterium]